MKMKATALSMAHAPQHLARGACAPHTTTPQDTTPVASAWQTSTLSKDEDDHVWGKDTCCVTTEEKDGDKPPRGTGRDLQRSHQGPCRKTLRPPLILVPHLSEARTT